MGPVMKILAEVQGSKLDPWFDEIWQSGGDLVGKVPRAQEVTKVS